MESERLLINRKGREVSRPVNRVKHCAGSCRPTRACSDLGSVEVSRGLGARTGSCDPGGFWTAREL